MSAKVINWTVSFATFLTLAALTTQAQDLLTDPDFDSAPVQSYPGQLPVTLPIPPESGWVVFGGASYYSGYRESGSIYSLREVEGPGAFFYFIGAYQVLGGVSAGQTYTLTADCSTLTGLGGFPGAVIELYYADAAGNPLQIVDTGTRTYFLPPAPDKWYTVSVTGTVPEGAVYLVPFLGFFMDGSQSSPVDLYWDKASLVLVPEPCSLVLLGMGLGIPFCLRRRQNS